MIDHGFNSGLCQVRGYAICIGCLAMTHEHTFCTGWLNVRIMCPIAVKRLIVECGIKRDSTYTGRVQHHKTAACGPEKME